MQPAAAKAVNNWISSADERGIESTSVHGHDQTIFFAERDVAVRLFSSLGSRQGHRKRSASVPNIQHPMMPQLPRSVSSTDCTQFI